MMKDQYANYVVQKMLDVVDQDQRGLLIARIRPHLQSLKRFTYGRHLLLSKLKGISLGNWKLTSILQKWKNCCKQPAWVVWRRILTVSLDLVYVIQPLQSSEQPSSINLSRFSFFLLLIWGYQIFPPVFEILKSLIVHGYCRSDSLESILWRYLCFFFHGFYI